MGGRSKALLPLGGFPLIRHVLDHLRGQVADIAISARDPAVAAVLPGLPLLPDRHADRRGPLAGILAGMVWCRAAHPDCRWLLSLPVDCPFVPGNLVPGLLTRAAAAEVRVVVAASAGVEHRAVALWDVTLADALAPVVEQAADLSIRRFYRRFPHAICDFPVGAIDPFLNINTPEALERAEDALRMSKNLEPIRPRDADQRDAGSLGLANGEEGRG
jgi:molybdopterin-guanine dinucleotide biosynthesis protein A